MRMLTIFVIASTCLMVAAGAEAHPQTAPQGPTIGDLQKQIAALTAALMACQASGGAKPAQDSDADHRAAIAALRAVGSAIDGGANVMEFKRYYLDAKVKVDALPHDPANEPLRRVSDMYGDAAMLLNAAQIAQLEMGVATGLKAKYPKDFQERPCGDLTDLGFGRRTTALETKIGVITAQACGQILLVSAGGELQALK